MYEFNILHASKLCLCYWDLVEYRNREAITKALKVNATFLKMYYGMFNGSAISIFRVPFDTGRC